MISVETCLPHPRMDQGTFSISFMTFPDTHGYCFIKKKSEVLGKFTALKALIENASGQNIKILRYDNGGEYVSNYFLHIFSQSGIQVQHSVPYTPQQNGVAERKNLSLKEMTTCMLKSNKLAANLWDEAMHSVEYIQNIFPHSSMKWKTPFKAYFR